MKTIIRQNKKAALQEFLFGSQKISSATIPVRNKSSLGASFGDTDMTKEFQSFKEKIEILQNQVDSLAKQVVKLQQRVIGLETLKDGTSFRKVENPKYAFRDQNKAPETSKSIQQGDSTLELKKGAHSESDDSRRYQYFADVEEMESDILSAQQKQPLKTRLESERYSIPSANESRRLSLRSQIPKSSSKWAKFYHFRSDKRRMNGVNRLSS